MRLMDYTFLELYSNNHHMNKFCSYKKMNQRQPFQTNHTKMSEALPEAGEMLGLTQSEMNEVLK